MFKLGLGSWKVGLGRGLYACACVCMCTELGMGVGVGMQQDGWVVHEIPTGALGSMCPHCLCPVPRGTPAQSAEGHAGP